MARKNKTEPRKDQTRLRRCLLCGEKFPSDGPHNRICKRSKTGQVWRQG
ncbi:MAG: hypothetical protein V3S40_00835 [Kiloniellales bacterium]